jgi:mRNA interferase MazF
LIPFPYTDLSAAKTRPAVVVSGDFYHSVRSELLLAYISSQVSKAHPTLDYMLRDWSSAGLPKPSFVRPKIAAIEPLLIVHSIGRLSERDQVEIDRRLRQALALLDTALEDIVAFVDLSTKSAATVQAIAEKALDTLASFATRKLPGVDIERLRSLLGK